MTISKNEMVKLLEATQYRQVSKMTRPGEFTVQAYQHMVQRQLNKKQYIALGSLNTLDQ